MEACDPAKQKIETFSNDESLISGQKITFSFQLSLGFSLLSISSYGNIFPSVSLSFLCFLLIFRSLTAPLL